MGFVNYILLFLLSLLFTNSFGQSNDIQARAFLNNLSFHGTGASAESYSGTPFNQPRSPFVINPYGVYGKVSYGGGIAFQRNTKSKLLLGMA